MDKKNFTDLSDEIKDMVQNAVKTKDFHQLNRDIGGTVKEALDEVRNAIGAGGGGYRYSSGNSDDPVSGRKQDRQEYRQSQAYNGNSPVKKLKIPQVPVGKVAGILYTVFGSIGMSIFGIGAFVLALIGQLTGKLNLFGTIALGLLFLFLVCFLLIVRGSSLRKRLQRFRRYIGAFQGNPYCSIKELSAALDLSRKYVIKDLRRMISLGMFPEGHIDQQETCIMLNRESYNQYLELQKNMRMHSLAEPEKVSREELRNRQGGSGKPDTANPEVRKAVEAGRACIQQIKEANDAIPGEEISRKLYRLEEVIHKIFLYIERHPNQLTDIQKFMDYYLPTTLKLVNAYKEFEKLSVQGENISSIKNEIEVTLDTINLAFENLLDSLYEDITMDVSSDISVLETLFAQEGLTRKDFVSND